MTEYQEVARNPHGGNTTTFHVGKGTFGVRLDSPPTIQRALEITKLDWEVEKASMEYSWGSYKFPMPDQRAIVRKDNHELLGVVGKGWQPFQNREAFGFFQPYLDDGTMSLECGGSLSGGRKVFILAKINVDPVDVVRNDAVHLYVMLSNAHDGSLSIRVGFTPFRGTCCNCLGYVHSLKDSKFLRLRHGMNIQQGLVKIREVLNVAKRRFEVSVQDYKAMAAADISVADLNTYVTRVFKPEILVGGKTFKDIEDEKAKKSAERLCGKIIPLFESGRGNDMPGVRGTYWGAFNAITEFTTHERGRSQDTRTTSLFYGDAAVINLRAREVAMKMLATG